MGATTSETVTVAVNEEFTVSLASTPTTGYIWDVRGLPEGVQLVAHDVQPGPGAVMPGSPSVEIFRFRVVSSGQHRIVLVLKRPWESTEVASHTVTVNVQ